MRFGTSGIRGVYGKEITEEKVFSFFSELKADILVVGNDARPFSVSLKHSAISSFQRKGDVVDIGMAPTGVLAFSTRIFGTLGAQFTASHNPPEYAGIKFFSRTGRNLRESGLEKGNGGEAGKVFRIDPRPAYFKAAMKFAKTFEPSCNILLDAGNGSASGFFEGFLGKFTRVDSINNFPNALEPNRALEPKPETLEKSIKYLRSSDAELGAAFDGDADRVVFFDREGFLGFNEMIGIIAREYIERMGLERRVVTTVEAGLMLDRILEGYGITRTKVGDINVAEMMPKHGAVGVEQPGHYIFHDFYPAPDVLLPVLVASSLGPERIREEIERAGRTYFMKKSIPADRKHEAVEMFRKRAGEFDYEEMNDMDGIFLKGKGWILLVRASGTEDVVRISADSEDRKTAEDLLEHAESIIREVVG